MTGKRQDVMYLGDSKASQAEQDWLIKSGLRKVTPGGFQDLGKQALAKYETYLEWIRPRMTAERAAYVRELRCVQNKSWRTVAGQACLEWGSDGMWEPITNQIAGIALCVAAAELLGEDVRAYPWEAIE
jgi:hypothetical protein